jgi:type I restriction enzyme M protein
MTDENIENVYRFCKNYEDVPEKAKIVPLETIKEKDYTLSVNSYIEKAIQESISPAEVRAKFFAALDEVYAAEKNLDKLLKANGYLHE